MNKVISFSSGKGGVGKTTLVTNLGSLWAKRGKRVLLIDGDWNLGKLSIALGVKPKWTVEQVLSQQISLQRAIQSVSPNLWLLASPSGRIGFEEMDETSRNQLFFEIDSLCGQYDLILFDHSSGAGWAVLQFAAASHQHVIVTTSEPTSYTDAYAIMKLLSKRFAIREFWVLVTMSPQNSDTEQVMARFGDVVRSHLDVRLHMLPILPWEASVVESIRRQRPLVDLFPASDLANKFQRVCEKLDSKLERVRYGLNFFYGQANPLATG